MVHRLSVTLLDTFSMKGQKEGQAARVRSGCYMQTGLYVICRQGWTLDHWLLIQETCLDLPHYMSPSSEMAWAYGDRSSWFAWDFPNVNTESPASRKSPQSLAHQVSWSPKPIPSPAHPARLVTLQFCLPYGLGDPAFHSLQASGLLADTAHTQGNAGMLKNGDTLLLFTSPPFSLWFEGY